MKKILFAASEAVPFVKTGGLADVVGSLPYAFDPSEWDVRVVLPAYTSISPIYREKMKDVTHFMTWFNGRDRYVGIRELFFRGVHYYFIDNEEYYGGAGPYTDYTYDIEKFTFFSHAVLAILPNIGFQPDIIHCHDWHSGLIPVYLKTRYAEQDFYRNIKTIFTIHNLKFQGVCDREYLMDISGLPGELFGSGPLCSGGCGNMMQGALVFSDAVTTVSKSYAEEIKTREYGEGLDWLLRAVSGHFYGIVNGIDETVFDPASDPSLKVHYSLSNLKSGKAASKKALQQELGLKEEKDSFLLGIVSRLTDQKGLDLIIPLLDKLTAPPFQLVVLGTGEYRYEMIFRQYAEARPDRIRSLAYYDEALSHRIYAGCDAFLMPSRFEPCGLGQLIALRFGTLPIVRATGGLKDTVRSFDKSGRDATGFVFEDYDVGGLNWGIDYALDTFRNHKDDWNRLVRNAMKEDFSWQSSAREYAALYQKMLS